MPDPVLRRGSQGAAVLELTERLAALGYLDGPHPVFGNQVFNAVRDFQEAHLDPRGRPLEVDGVVGPLTWWALRTEVLPDDFIPGPVENSIPLPPGGSMAGRAALSAALEEMQAGAKEEGANNSGPWVEKYLNGLAPTPNNWCAGFVSWCYAHTDGGIPFRYSLGARDVRNQFRAKGWAYQLADQDPQPGDIIVWWRGKRDGWQGHIGLVYAFEHGILSTIEGNRGSMPAPVNMFDYTASRIEKLLGFGHVPD